LESSLFSAPEALVCLDTSNECTQFWENHGCEPVLGPGQELGQLGVHVAEGTGSNVSTASVNSVITGSVEEHSELASVQKG